MKLRHALLTLGVVAITAGQSASKAVVTNLDTANWTHDKESDSVLLHTDPATGGMELRVRFPAGHVIAPHWHESNERIIVLEGQLTLKQDDGYKIVKTGGLAYLPEKEVQRLSCSSISRCTFYLAWDGKPQSHAAK